ncbi:putative Helix-turn-helix domain of transposase IS66 [compost metagenome]
MPPQFPRTLIHHEPDTTQCACGCQLKRIGEDVSEKLDYTPGVFTVERHIRGKLSAANGSARSLLVAWSVMPRG